MLVLRLSTSVCLLVSSSLGLYWSQRLSLCLYTQYAVGLAPIVVAEIAAGVMGFAFRDSFVSVLVCL